jgi:hypothetical protein
VNIVHQPCKEVNSISVVSRTLLGAIRRGFRTNAYRVHVQDVDELYRCVGSIHPQSEITPMRPLDADDCSVSISAELPPSVLNGHELQLEVTVTNKGSCTLLSTPPHPVNVAFELADADGVTVGCLENRRAPLLDPIGPGQEVLVQVRLQVPDEPGSYTMTITLVQVSICWFNALSPENELRAAFVVDGRPNGTLTAYASHAAQR